MRNAPGPRYRRRRWEIADGPEALEGALEALAGRHDAVVVDTPGRPDPAARRAHAHADVLITPLNDSHVDLDLIGRLEAGSRLRARPGVYAEMVWKQRMVRAGAGRRALDWIVMLNRVRQVDSRNTREVRSLLQDLSRRFAFNIAPGFGERTIFREMFPDGLGLMDLRRPGVERTLSMSHVAARNEVRRLLDMLGVPPALAPRRRLDRPGRRLHSPADAGFPARFRAGAVDHACCYCGGGLLAALADPPLRQTPGRKP